MRMMRWIWLAVAGAALSACGGTGDMVMRNAPLDLGPAAEIAAPQSTRSYEIVELNFVAPEALTVSERNGYYPLADIVWRGDAIGDRKAQLAAIFQEAFDRGAAQVPGTRPVVVDIALVRFHGVTERVRYSVGGNYNMIFDMTVRDATTGAVIEPARRITGNLAAPGGTAAIMAEQAGQTEKVRVTDYLTVLLQDELSGPVTVASR